MVWTIHEDKEFAPMIVLLTGTSTGIGLASAVQVAAAGHQAVATMRDPARADALRSAADKAGVTVDIRRLDVTDEQAVRACVDAVVADYGRLDALVNNAGAGHVGTVELDTMAAYRASMEVNYFSVVSTTRSALPHLRASGGRLVTVTSVGGVVGQPFNEAYCAAKFAVEGFMESLAPVAAALGVAVCIVEPGPVATEFVANTGADPAALIAAAGPYAPAMQAYATRTLSQFATAAQHPYEVAAVVLRALTEEQPAFRRQTSPVATQFTGTKLADQTGSAVLALTGGWLA
jgi:NAD(P)-dependent dehydrogenase (short-subunit alcohol dehydrogenase family)